MHGAKGNSSVVKWDVAYSASGGPSPEVTRGKWAVPRQSWGTRSYDISPHHPLHPYPEQWELRLFSKTLCSPENQLQSKGGKVHGGGGSVPRPLTCPRHNVWEAVSSELLQFPLLAPLIARLWEPLPRRKPGSTQGQGCSWGQLSSKEGLNSMCLFVCVVKGGQIETGDQCEGAPILTHWNTQYKCSELKSFIKLKKIKSLHKEMCYPSVKVLDCPQKAKLSPLQTFSGIS